MCVLLDLHKYIVYYDQFEDMISKKDVDDYLMYSFVETNFDMNQRELEPFEPPKILGDVFEAVIGAIFEDGGLEQVVRVFKHILSPIVLYLAKFSKILLKEAKESFIIKSMTEYMMRPKYKMQ